jgi:hypothetical protein
MLAIPVMALSGVLSGRNGTSIGYAWKEFKRNYRRAGPCPLLARKRADRATGMVYA